MKIEMEQAVAGYAMPPCAFERAGLWPTRLSAIGPTVPFMMSDRYREAALQLARAILSGYAKQLGSFCRASICSADTGSDIAQT